MSLSKDIHIKKKCGGYNENVTTTARMYLLCFEQPTRVSKCMSKRLSKTSTYNANNSYARMEGYSSHSALNLIALIA